MFVNLRRKYTAWNEAHSDIAALPWLFLAILILMSVATRGRFLSAGNITNLLAQMPELGLLSLAMMIAMLSGGIDLSIISSANLSAVCMALFLTNISSAGDSATGGAVFLALLLGLAVSAALGVINGFLVGYVAVPAVLATLGTMILYEGVTLAITRGFVISGLPRQFLFIGNARVFGIPFQVFVFGALVYLVSLLVRRRPYGCYLYFVGSNEIATKFSGVDVRRVLLKTYVLSNLLAGAAAIVMLSRFNSANARQGNSLLLSTVLICMLGGTDPFGGFGKVSGLVMSLVVLQMVTSGLNLLGLRSFATLAIWGAMLVGVMTYRHFQGKIQEQRSTLLQ